MLPEDCEDFDFEKWAVSPIRPTFMTCLRSAIAFLALGDNRLRDRLQRALFCLMMAEQSDVPHSLQSSFDEIVSYVTERSDTHAIHSDTKEVTKRMKYRTARRLSQQIVKLYEQAVSTQG